MGQSTLVGIGRDLRQEIVSCRPYLRLLQDQRQTHLQAVSTPSLACKAELHQRSACARSETGEPGKLVTEQLPRVQDTHYGDHRYFSEKA